MNWITIAIGAFALGFGIYSTYVRMKTPEKFGKLAAMRQQFIHTVAYSVIPIIAGIIFIVLGIQGGALF